MPITMERDPRTSSIPDQTPGPFRLCVPNVSVPSHAPATEPTVSTHTESTDTVTIANAEKTADSKPTVPGRLRLGTTGRTRHPETKSTEERRPSRSGRKWQSRLWVAAMSLTCLSGAALLFGMLEGDETDGQDEDVVSVEESTEISPGSPAVPGSSAVVPANLQTGATDTAPTIRPVLYETSDRATAAGSAPRGAWLDGSIVLEDATPAHPSKPHGAH